MRIARARRANGLSAGDFGAVTERDGAEVILVVAVGGNGHARGYAQAV